MKTDNKLLLITVALGAVLGAAFGMSDIEVVKPLLRLLFPEVL